MFHSHETVTLTQPYFSAQNTATNQNVFSLGNSTGLPTHLCGAQVVLDGEMWLHRTRLDLEHGSRSFKMFPLSALSNRHHKAAGTLFTFVRLQNVSAQINFIT